MLHLLNKLNMPIMKLRSLFTVFSLPWLLLLNSSTNTTAVQVLPHFSAVKVRSCPAASLLAQRLDSKLQCAAVCSRLKSCNAFHFDQPNNKCYLGDACSELAQWTAGDCDSYKYTDVLCGDCDVAKPEFTQLQMKMFYKFSRSGLLNEVNPRLFCLTAHNVIVDAGGAQLKGNPSSYLSTETPGFEACLDYGRNYSFYMQISEVLDTNNRIYHRYQVCSGDTISPANTFGRSSEYAYNYAAWSSSHSSFGYLKAVSNILFGTTGTIGTVSTLSLGMTYTATQQTGFFFNGTLTAVGQFVGGVDPVPWAEFHCLRLGYHSISDKCLKGSIACYGLALKAFSLAEFSLMEKLCVQA